MAVKGLRNRFNRTSNFSGTSFIKVSTGLSHVTSRVISDLCTSVKSKINLFVMGSYVINAIVLKAI